MSISFHILNVLVGMMNAFKGQQYRCMAVNRVTLIYDQNYDVVIRDYYSYIKDLLLLDLNNCNKRCVVLLDLKYGSFLKHLFPCVRVSLQIEHTLVKPGARGSGNALSGDLKMLDSQEKYLVRVANLEKLEKADIVIDYSRINLLNVKSSAQYTDLAEKSFSISPAVYAMDPQNFMNGSTRVFDTITTFGNPNESRRKAFLEELRRRNIPFENVNNTFENVDSLYQKTKILINIRQTDHHDTLEELRVLPALRCGVIVISEIASYCELTRYAKFVIWGKLEELPDLVLSVQRNYAEVHASIFGGSAFYRRMERISRCNELTAFEVTNKISKLLN